MRGKQSRCGSAISGNGLFRFYFLNPRGNQDISKIADALMAFEEVEEVHVTEGDHGFVVKAKLNDGKESAVSGYMSRIGACRFKQATAYASYVK